MTGPSLDWDKLGRFAAGEASPEEAAEVRRWLASHPDDDRLLAVLDELARDAVGAPGVDAEDALRRVKTRIRATTTPAARWRRYVAWTAVAAAVVAAVVLVPRRPTVTAPSAVATATYTSGVGERREIALSDGSRVTLGPATTLAVRGREAELHGEALFDVRHDALRPFVVRANGATIRDVGTRFTVHSDAGGVVRVVVSEGAVELVHRRDSVTLSRGDVGLVQAGGAVRLERGAASDDDLAWTRGRLVFRDAPVGELAADLRRWYGVELRVTDSALLRRHFTGSFATESRDRVLQVIALALGARVERRGDTAYVRPALTGR